MLRTYKAGDIGGFGFDSQSDVLEVLRQIIRKVFPHNHSPLCSTYSAFQIRSSAVRRQIFDDIVRAEMGGNVLQLILDVVTRWSSTFLMIQRALNLERVSNSGAS
jgi:hypothetical protein